MNDEDIKIESEPATAHTPGPWKTNKPVYLKNVKGIGISSPGEWVDLAHCFEGFRTEECEANARLVAAAPDLLAACERAFLQIQNCDCTNGVTSPMGDQDEGNTWSQQTLDQLHAAIAKAKGTTP